MSVKIIRASAHRLSAIPDKSVHTLITSWPYFGLRKYDGDQAEEWPSVTYKIAPIPPTYGWAEAVQRTHKIMRSLPDGLTAEQMHSIRELVVEQLAETAGDGLATITIPGCDPDCAHDWSDATYRPSGHTDDGVATSGLQGGKSTQSQSQRQEIDQHYCRKCGGWRGGLGNEPTIEAYIGHLVLCAREWRRILRDDGTMWLNAGDSYSGSWGNYGSRAGGQRERVADKFDRRAYNDKERGWDGKPSTANLAGLKRKDLCMIPARAILALQADGWYVRSDIPWVKHNAMPGSQSDRPTIAHESIYLLSKSEMYYYDQKAVLLPYADGSVERMYRGVGDGHKNIDGAPGQSPHSFNQPRMNKSHTFAREGSKREQAIPGQSVGTHRPDREDNVYGHGGRVRRTSDWFFDGLAYILGKGQGMLRDEDGDPLAVVVNTKGFKGAHFATYPIDLVTPMILASTSERGVCPECGAPWERVVDTPVFPKELRAKPGDDGVKVGYGDGEHNSTGSGAAMQKWREENPPTTLGWRPTCEHYPRVDEWIEYAKGKASPEKDAKNQEISELRSALLAAWESCETIPATVFDPFHGSGTTGKAAVAKRRSYIGSDISEEYLSEHDRISGTQIEMF